MKMMTLNNMLKYSIPQHKMKPTVVFRSSAEVEYRVVANNMVEACWLCQLLLELHNPLSLATLVYYDNINAVCLSTNPIQH
jgi:hypothetical protein